MAQSISSFLASIRILLLSTHFMNHMEVVVNDHPSECLHRRLYKFRPYPCQSKGTGWELAGGLLNCFCNADLPGLIGSCSCCDEILGARERLKRKSHLTFREEVLWR